MKQRTFIIGALAGMGLWLNGAAAHAESYFAVYGGTSSTKNSSLLVQQPEVGTDITYQDVSWSAKPFEAPPYYGFKWGGYSRTQPNWGFEVDFTHYKVYADTNRTLPVSGVWRGTPVSGTDRLGDRIQRYSISHGVNILAFNALYRLTLNESPSFPHGRLQPYIGFGLGFYILHPETVVDGKPHDEGYKVSNLGWQAMGGLRYGITEKTGLFIEAKYDRTKAETEVAEGGWAHTRLRTWHGILGVHYNY